MKRWLNGLKRDPLPSLLNSGNSAIVLYARRDLLGEDMQVEDLWQSAEVERVLRRQNADGGWTYPGGSTGIRTKENYNQLETYRQLGILVEANGLDKRHPSIRNAAEYLFAFQAKAGDFRGIYGNQYSPNYSAGITELLTKAGYQSDPRIQKVFAWLASIRQRDGGWAIPLRTRGFNLNAIANPSKPIEPDPLRRYSHMITGVVLRAFAADPIRRHSKEARVAGQLLSSSLFKRDSYTDRAAPSYWLGFCFPFWFTDLISALDSLSVLGFSKDDSHVSRALQWLVDAQQADGTWKLRILKSHSLDAIQMWLGLAICRIFRRLSPGEAAIDRRPS